MYARAVRSLRLRELQNVECMTAVRAGLGSIIPLQLLTMLIPLEMELRTCGLPYINLEFLKVMFSIRSTFLCLIRGVLIHFMKEVQHQSVRFVCIKLEKTMFCQTDNHI